MYVVQVVIFFTAAILIFHESALLLSYCWAPPTGHLLQPTGDYFLHRSPARTRPRLWCSGPCRSTTWKGHPCRVTSSCSFWGMAKVRKRWAWQTRRSGGVTSILHLHSSSLFLSSAELLIPNSANAFYAMNPAGPCDFLLRHKEGAPSPSSLGTTHSRSKATLQNTSPLKDLGNTAFPPTSCSTSSHGPPYLTPSSLAQLFPHSCASYLKPPLRLLTPRIPGPSCWFLGAQQPDDLLCSPPTSPSLPPHLLNLEPFSPLLPQSPASSLWLGAQTPTALAAQSLSHHPLGASSWTESPNHCDVPHLSAAQNRVAGKSPGALLPHSGEVGP